MSGALRRGESTRASIILQHLDTHHGNIGVSKEAYDNVRAHYDKDGNGEFSDEEADAMLRDVVGMAAKNRDLEAMNKSLSAKVMLVFMLPSPCPSASLVLFQFFSH